MELDNTLLTPQLLRDHSKSPMTMAWVDQARMLLDWAADALEAAQQIREGK